MNAPVMTIPFHRHDVGAAELAAVGRALASPFLSCGPLVEEFERAFAAELGAGGSVATSSCTLGLYVALQALGLAPGDEVIVPALTFAATANAVELAGGRPRFCDVDARTGLIDVEHVAASSSPRTRGVVAVHLYGQLAPMEPLRALADQRGWWLLEDAAHCVEGSRSGVRAAALGHAAVFSFYATKSITSGEGGAIVSNDAAFLSRCRIHRCHGMNRSAYARHGSGNVHPDLVAAGLNAKMSELHAAVLLPQLGAIGARHRRRRAIAAHYDERFDAAGIARPRIDDACSAAFHLYTVWAGDAAGRDGAIARLQQRGIGVGIHYPPVPALSYYREKYGHRPGDLPRAEAIGAATLSIPLYPTLSDAQVEYVARAVVEAVRCP